MVAEDRVERHRPQQRRTRSRAAEIRIVDREEVSRVLGVQAPFVDVVTCVHHEIRAHLVGVPRNRPLAGRSIRVVSKGDEPNRRAARLACRQMPFDDRAVRFTDSIVVSRAERERRNRRRIVATAAARWPRATIAGRDRHRRVPPVGGRGTVVDREFCRAVFRLPGDHDGLLVRREGSRGAGLDIGQRGEEERPFSAVYGPRRRPGQRKGKAPPARGHEGKEGDATGGARRGAEQLPAAHFAMHANENGS